MDHKALIIDSPDLQLAAQRRSWAFVKSVGWLLWFMLWLPMFTLLGWYFGYETIIVQFVDRKGSAELVRLLPTYVLVISVCGGSLVIWSLVQYWRFHGRNRRSTSPDLETIALAKMTKNSVEAVQSWQGARRVVAYHDANAKIVTVETNPNALYGKALIAAAQAVEAIDSVPSEIESSAVTPQVALAFTPTQMTETPLVTITSVAVNGVRGDSVNPSATSKATTTDIDTARKPKKRRTKKQRANGAFA